MPTEYTIHPISGRRIVQLQPTAHEPIGRGSDLKQIVRGEVKHENAVREVSFLERKPDEPEVWIENWKMLYDAGFPVPPTLRKTEHGTLLISNLKQNGAEMYGKGNMVEVSHLEGRNQQIPFRPIDARFLEVYKRDRELIQKQAQELADKATELSIILPPDDMFELLLQQDGSWKLMIVDLAFSRRAKSKDEAAEENNDGVKMFMYDLENVSNYLQVLPHLPPKSPAPHTPQLKSVFEPNRP